MAPSRGRGRGPGLGHPGQPGPLLALAAHVRGLADPELHELLRALPRAVFDGLLDAAFAPRGRPHDRRQALPPLRPGQASQRVLPPPADPAVVLLPVLPAGRRPPGPPAGAARTRPPSSSCGRSTGPASAATAPWAARTRAVVTPHEPTDHHRGSPGRAVRERPGLRVALRPGDRRRRLVLPGRQGRRPCPPGRAARRRSRARSSRRRRSGRWPRPEVIRAAVAHHGRHYRAARLLHPDQPRGRR